MTDIYDFLNWQQQIQELYSDVFSENFLGLEEIIVEMTETFVNEVHEVLNKIN